MDEYRKDIDKAQQSYEATKASAEQLASVTGHKFDDPGKDLTSHIETLNQALTSWTKSLQGNDANAAEKGRVAAKAAYDSMMQVVTKYESAVQSAKPDKLPGKKFHTDWGDLMARDDKGAATALALVADLKKAIAANYSNADRFYKSRDMLDHIIGIKPMADFLANPESVQAAVQKSAEENKGKIGAARQQAQHADHLETEDKGFLSQLTTVKTLVDQMSENVEAISKQVESEKLAGESAELKEKAEKIEAAYDFMGEVATCFLKPDPKEIAGKLGELAVKTGFKLLGKLDTQDIRARAEDLQKLADKYHKDSLTQQSTALIGALKKFDEIAPDLEKNINSLAKRAEAQTKQAGDKFDDVCENCTFHFYDVESAVKLAYTTLDLASTGRGALDDALGIPAAIGRAVLRTSQEIPGMAGAAMEKAFQDLNGPTIDTAQHEVERQLASWKTGEQKITEAVGKLLEVREQALQALADYGG
jgi:hypothetical protein